jgi:hypothetical protein
MGTSAETANVDYRSLFADHEKQTSVFCLQQTNGSLLVSVSSIFLKYIDINIYIGTQHMYRYIDIDIDLYIEIYIYSYTVYLYIYWRFKGKTEKRKPRRFFLIIYRLLIVQTEICRLSVCLWRNKGKLSVCKRPKRTKRTCPSMLLTSSKALAFDKWKP